MSSLNGQSRETFAQEVSIAIGYSRVQALLGDAGDEARLLDSRDE